MVKATAVYCPGCGQHWQKAATPQSETYDQDYGQQWRQPSSPRQRQRPKSPRSRTGKDKGGGKGKHKWQQPTAPSYAVAPWHPPPPPPGAPEPRGTGEGDQGVQELLTVLRSTMSQQALPPAVAEALARVDVDAGRMVTKTIHNHTNAMGAAKKQLHSVRVARQQQEAAWVEFLSKTIEALEKGAQKFQETMNKFVEQEAEAAQRLAQARKAIRELATESTEKDVKEEAEDLDDSDIELMDTSASTGTGVAEEAKVQQVQKKLRVTLDELMAKLPSTEEGTPRRRSRGAPSGGPALPPTEGPLIAPSPPAKATAPAP